LPEGTDLKISFKDYEQLDGKLEHMVEKVGDGSIVTRFDKTPVPQSPTDVVCPHFLELKWATGCPYACAWCYLQGTFRFLEYKKQPRPKDFDRVEAALTYLFENDGRRPEILNAGELSDSMITERSSRPFTRFVMDLMAKQSKHKVLFVTKSTDIDNLLKVENKEQAIVSFSLNAKKVAAQWEKAPTPEKRIEAAGKLKDGGFEVRLRIDPMVPIEDWREDYLHLVDLIFDRLTPDRITIGSLRGLQSTINNAPDRSWTVYLEEQSNWGRKIPTETRLEMYRALIESLRDDHRFKKVALCKETVDMWELLGMDWRHPRCNCNL
jgi:spore photoproduct lyase